ncbi:MAG: hypothetical protein M1819_006448 [Sarea resinae]|nr:MAG: hypothetical protein M1819_006448 [Sarea resinae]
MSFETMDVEKEAVQEDDELQTEPQATEGKSLENEYAGSPENPRNWGRGKKVYHVGIVASYGFVVTFATSVYTPGITSVMARFHVSETVGLFGLCFYTLGLGCGPIIAAPLSETYGRSIVYRVSLPIFALFILGSGLAQNCTTLVVCRFMAGVFGGPALSVGGGTIADIWPRSLRAPATNFYALAPFLGPAIGPVIGGYVAASKGWRWTQWAIIFFAIATFLFSLFIAETSKKILLRRHAARLGLKADTTPKPKASVKTLLIVTLGRPCTMLATEPIVTFLSAYVGFNFAVLFSFFAAFRLIFGRVYGFDTGQIGLVFLAIGLGCLLGTATGLLLDRLVYQKHAGRAKHREAVSAEHRLHGAMMGAFGLPIGLFWLAWTARRDVHWASPVFAAVPFAWGNLTIFMSAVLYLVDMYGDLYGASALAAIGFVRYLLAFAFPLFTIQMYDRLGIAWATSLLGFISLLLLPIPWVLYKHGPRIRARSAYQNVES